MAGEWLAIDMAVQDKPEFQEIMDLTGLDEPYVLWWLRKMWNWASMHCADGTARMTLPRMVRTWGADEAFWRAVKAVGWLEIDEEAATVAVPGWDRRFSKAAKARIQHRDRAADQADDRLRSGADTACAEAQAPPAPARSRGYKRIGDIPPPPREAAPGGWEEFRRAWNHQPAAGRRKAWKPATPPHGREAVFHDAAWLEAAGEAMGRLPACRYFDSPVTLIQFAGDGFVQRVLGGQYDSPKTATARPAGPGRPDDRPPAKGWEGEDLARLKATQLRDEMARKLREGVA